MDKESHYFDSKEAKAWMDPSIDIDHGHKDVDKHLAKKHMREHELPYWEKK